MERIHYIIFVLWMHGYSLQRVSDTVSKLTGDRWTRHRIWNVIQPTPFSSRSSMSLALRQRHLDNLKAERMDDGALRDFVFVANTIWGKK